MNTAKYTSVIFSVAALCMMVMTIAGCKKYKEFDDVLFITGTETNKLVKFTVEGVPSSFGVTVSASTKVSENITVNFQVDTSLVKTYNEERSANYFAVDEYITRSFIHFPIRHQPVRRRIHTT